jgi:uncharacterized membrane protein YfcA
MGDEVLSLLPFALIISLSGFLSGYIAGLLGVGGGIIIVPLLYHFLSLAGVQQDLIMHISVATSLAVIIPTGWRSFKSHKEKNGVDFQVLRFWLLPTLVGSVIGANIAGFISGFWLTFNFALIALLVSINLFIARDVYRLGDSIPKGFLGFSIPCSVGALSAMLGIGGGTFNVSLMTLFGHPIHKAVGTASGLGFYLAIPGTLFFIITGWNVQNLPPGSLGYVNIIGLLLIAPISSLSAPIGARSAHNLNKKFLTNIFAFFLLLTSARMFLEIFR